MGGNGVREWARAACVVVAMILGALQAQGAEQKPAADSNVRWKEEFLNRFYPLANPWSRVYLVRFSIPPGTPEASSISVSLSIAGPPGKATLGWKENFTVPVPEAAPAPITAPILNEKTG